MFTAHAGEAIESAPAQQVDQHGLGLIISGVAGQDVDGKHAISGGAGARLDVGARPTDVDSLRAKGCTEPRGGGSNDLCFAIGTVAELVVDVDSGDVEAGGTGERQQRQ